MADNGQEERRSIISFIKNIDRMVARSMSLCSHERSLLGPLRPMFRMVELSGHGGLWLLLTALLFFVVEEAQVKESLLNLQLALIVDILIVGAIKTLFQRNRPPQNVDDQGNILVDRYSMPSGHVSRALLVYTFAHLNFDLHIFWMDVLKLWMILVVVSRLLMARHYLSDTIVGGVLGVIEAAMIMPGVLWVDLQALGSAISRPAANPQ